MSEHKRTYRRYDEDFKNEVLDQVRQGRPVKEVADAFGIQRALIHQWKAKSERGGSSESEELKALRKKVQELERDKQVLKKALSIFSRK
jgi:transposase